MKQTPLSQLLLEATKRADIERQDQLKIERITRDVKARIAAADDKKHNVSCPACGHEFSTAFRPDTVTSETSNDDDVNQQDGAGAYSVDAGWDAKIKAIEKEIAEARKHKR